MVAIVFEKVNEINMKYFRLYLLICLVWGVLGLVLVSFPNKLAHILIISASVTALIRIKSYTNHDDKKSIFILCWILSIIGIISLAI